ncbi:MAG: Uma2 family endonuclease [Candidatus Tectimicrobiota bacterium]
MSQDVEVQSATLPVAEIIYPDSDGKPMADNTRQYQDIITIQVGLDSLFAARPDVFVAADLCWYPVEGQPGIRQAPDVLVAFGRPKGHRGSYKQWEEGAVAPQVVMEILLPSNRRREMTAKRLFYERYGVQEYYAYDPDRGRLEVWQRQGDRLLQVTPSSPWTSPLLGIRLTLKADGALRVQRPDGRVFLRPMDIEAEAEQERQRAEQAEQRTQRLAARLRALGVDPETLTE